jgi:hypothetical protein
MPGAALAGVGGGAGASLHSHACDHVDMDTSTIDQAYGQLQGEFQDVAKSIQALAEKLAAAADGGDANAKEWQLDLKQVALDVKDEQLQVNTLLQAIHSFVDDSNKQLQQQAEQMPQHMRGGMMGGGMMGGGMMGGGMMGGPFSGFLGGGFGRAMEMGAGIGLGEDLISKIF